VAEFKIFIKPSVEKDLRALHKDVLARVIDKIGGLRKAPFPQQSQKLSGAERLYRIRVGDYRIVYEVEKQDGRITVHYVRHRRDVYRDL
jgi:mRNA interferase RelE/StbE